MIVDETRRLRQLRLPDGTGGSERNQGVTSNLVRVVIARLAHPLP